MTYHHFEPAEMVHIVADAGAGGRTLCGIEHDGDVRSIGDDPDDVLPSYKKYCQRCRAAYVERVVDDLSIDRTALEEGDVVEYWTHDDPTDPSSSLCLRKAAVIVETPPWELPGRDGPSEMTGCYKVQQGVNTYASARFERIWRVNHRPPEDILSKSIVREAFGGSL